MAGDNWPISGDPRPAALTPGRAALWLLAAAVSVVVIVVLVREVPSVGDAWRGAAAGGGWWLLALVACELVSFAGYVEAFHRALGGGLIDRSASWLITLAGVAATRLLAAGGAGGIALTSWALVRARRPAREVTVGVTAFLVSLYAVFLGLLAVSAALLLSGLVESDAPRGLALIGLLIAVGGLGLLLPRNRDLLHRLAERARGRRRVAAAADGFVNAVDRGGEMLRSPRFVAGALAWWTFDILALGLALHRLGAEVPVAVLVLAYTLGLFGNLLPIPGGFGGVEGGMIGMLVACGVAVGPAVAGVLAYRFVALWLPTALGVVAQAVLTARVRRWQAGVVGG